MTSWWRRWLEKRHNRFYEGFEVPTRYHAEVEAFAAQGPHTRQEWAHFAMVLAHRTYAEGWVRGMEYVERDPESWEPEIDPAVIADEGAPGWRNIPMDIEDPTRVVEETIDEVQMLRDGMDKLLRQHIENPDPHPLIRDARKGPGGDDA
jgi:hypothetical protein